MAHHGIRTDTSGHQQALPQREVVKKDSSFGDELQGALDGQPSKEARHFAKQLFQNITKMHGVKELKIENEGVDWKALHRELQEKASILEDHLTNETQS